MFVEAYLQPKNTKISLDEIRKCTPRARRILREAYPELDERSPSTRRLMKGVQITSFLFGLLVAIVLDAILFVWPGFMF